MSRKTGRSRKRKEDVEPEDPLDKALMEHLRFERQSTEIDRNQYLQEVIKMKRERLRQRGKELQTNSFSDMTFEETVDLVKELPTQKFYLFMLIGNLVDRGKKLTPKELRKEVAALVKAVPLRDQSEVDKFYLDGLKKGAELQAKISQSFMDKKSREESSRMTAKLLGKILEGYEPPKPAGTPMTVDLYNKSGTTTAGSWITIPTSIYGGTELVRVFVRGQPEGMTSTCAFYAVKDPLPRLAGNIEWRFQSSTKAGVYKVTVVAKDADGKEATAPYTLTVANPTQRA